MGNLAKGESCKKQHLRSGSSTACNIRTSGANNNDFKYFQWWADGHSSDCCKKCLKEFNEKRDRLIAKKLKDF